MAVLTAPDESKPIASPRVGVPFLRLRREDGADERAVELSDGKWTVGSSAQCQIHLPSVDVRPLQCVIVVEGAVASVTRWASGIRLNDRDFSKATLKGGDALTLGGWTLQFDRHASGQTTEATSAGIERNSVSAATAFEPSYQPDESPDEDAGPVRAETPTPAAAIQPLVEPIDGPVAAEASSTAWERPSAEVQAFQDRLVLNLWTANFQARSRAKSLVNGMRAARFHADAMTADLAAMETELDLARAAYDSHLSTDDRLQQELAELRQNDEWRIASLNEEIVALRSQLAWAEGALAERTAEYENQSADAASREQLAASAGSSAAAEARAAEYEAAMAAQAQLVSQLTQQLRSLQEERQQLAEKYQTQCERSAQLEQELAAKLEHSVTAAPFAEPQDATVSNDVWQSVQPVESPAAQVAPQPASWDSFDPIVEDSAPTIAPAATFDPAAALAVLDEQALSQTSTGMEAPIEPAATFAASETAPVSRPSIEEQPASPVHPATEHASTSFIDKYRHLLDEDDAPDPVSSGGPRPFIEEEFLSPAKAQACPSPADDSDEALEAYMANMMRRVRGSESTFARQPAPMRTHEPAARFRQPAEPPQTDSTYSLASDLLNSDPISFEDLKAATRKVPLASDLEALREIANSTARKAIHTHVQRRSRESAITKLIVAVTAMVSAAYLMASAPALDNWQFWTGAATCVVGIGAAVQVLILERRRQG